MPSNIYYRKKKGKGNNIIYSGDGKRILYADKE